MRMPNYYLYKTRQVCVVVVRELRIISHDRQEIHVARPCSLYHRLLKPLACLQCTWTSPHGLATRMTNDGAYPADFLLELRL